MTGESAYGSIVDNDGNGIEGKVTIAIGPVVSTYAVSSDGVFVVPGIRSDTPAYLGFIGTNGWRYSFDGQERVGITLKSGISLLLTGVKSGSVASAAELSDTTAPTVAPQFASSMKAAGQASLLFRVTDNVATVPLPLPSFLYQTRAGGTWTQATVVVVSYGMYSALIPGSALAGTTSLQYVISARDSRDNTAYYPSSGSAKPGVISVTP